MKQLLAYGALLLSLLAACSPPTRMIRSERHLLVYLDSASRQLPAAELLLSRIEGAAAAAQARVSVTDRRSWLQLDTLMQYSALALVLAEVDSFRPSHKTDIEAYLEGGGGLLALHAPLTMPHTWPWYEPLGMPDTVPGELRVQRASLTEEEGLFRKLPWGGGRAAVAEGREEDLRLPDLEAQIAGAIAFAIGDNSWDSARVRVARAPDDQRFTRWLLSEGLDEPMEMAILPDLSVIFIERKGAMKRYDPATQQTRLLAQFEVCTSGNYEDGLLGIALDPQFQKNHYLYMYWSPDCALGVQRLSRFTMVGTDSLILASEKIVLEVPVQREECCHSGGSLAFGPDGCLYLSTGDNTNPKESEGYTPIDERPGRSAFDAQKSSANTQDLRGKVLRILPNKYGSYDIPPGNMFPKDGSKGRPEIYAMGMRNPFRISLDERTGYLYWGDVGPDNAYPGKYGPGTYDEVNQCRGPGFFGWPYFVGPNEPFRARDFSSDAVGDYFDPSRPVNRSPNNGGLQELPPAQPAFIYYKKSRTRRFPMLGEGSSSAMAGPVYHRSAGRAASPVSFPAYFEGKLFIYEWARSWIQVVTMDSAGQVERIEPFLPKMPLSKPIDLEFGPDGAMYVLEYGKDYFLKNPEARLVRITYAAGNRRPIPELSIDLPAGSVPHTLRASAAGSRDFDEKDSLRFEWSFGDSARVDARGPEAQFTFTEAGEYTVTLRAIDRSGERASKTARVFVGNAPPRVSIRYAGNQRFFFDEPGGNAYEISVEDAEDQANGNFRPENLQVAWLHADHPEDAEVLLGAGKQTDHAASLRFLKGWQLIQSSDCMSCHAIEHKSAGPGYKEVARRYQGQAGAEALLIRKIYEGGNGNWGREMMPGHPQHTEAEIREMVRYILSLADERQLPPQGRLTAAMSGEHAPGGAYLLAATYTDQGANGLPPASGRSTLLLLHPRMGAETAAEMDHFYLMTLGANRDIAAAGSYGRASLRFKDLDMKGIRSARLRLSAFGGGTLSLRSGSPSGPLLGQVRIPPGPGGNLEGADIPWQEHSLPIRGQEGLQDVFLLVEPAGEGLGIVLDWIEWKL